MYGRLNLDNPDWKHPSERNEERYYVAEVDEVVDPKTGKIKLTDRQCCGSMTFWCGSGSADPYL
jgi:hypothetical protein